MLDCKNHKKRTIELINELREESAKQAASFSQYLGDKLTVKYAKNYKDIEWYQNKAKDEISEEYYKKRVNKRKKKIKENKDHGTNWKKKREDEVKKSKEIIKNAEKQAKEEQKAIEQKFDAERAKEDVMDEIKEKNQNKSTSGLEGEEPYVTDFREEQEKKNKEKAELDKFVDSSDEEQPIPIGNADAIAEDRQGGGTRKHRRRRNRNTKKKRNKNK
jgi:hypothetical protein